MPAPLTRRLLVLIVTLVVVGGALLVIAARPLLSGAGGGRADTPADAPVVVFPAADAFAIVEIARTGPERQRGLMDRASLAEGAGMLFVFPTTVSSPFWMRNTRVPLSIAFIDEASVIVDIQDMEPLDETLHYPAAPYRYALEVPQGWFARAGVVIGQRVELPPGVDEGVT